MMDISVVIPVKNRPAYKIVRRVRRFWYGLCDPSFPRVLTFLFRRKAHNFVRNRERSVANVPTDHVQTELDAGQAAETIRLFWQAEFSGRIPKLIFQTWKTKEALPANYDYWSRTFRRYNHDFAYVLWDDEDNRKFIESHFAWFAETYNSFPSEIFRVDAVRMFFMFYYGGFYVDLDSECLRPLEDLLGASDVLLGYMGRDKEFQESIPNAIMASKPFEGFWLVAIKIMIDTVRDTDFKALEAFGPVGFTGPILIKKAVDFYLSSSRDKIRSFVEPLLQLLDVPIAQRVNFGKVYVLSREQWYPLDWTNPFHRMVRAEVVERKMVLTPEEACALFPNSHMVSYWTHSW